MLVYSIAFLALAAGCLATPPPGYVEKPDNDKDPPAYKYEYEIGDEAGKGHGKTESRNGKLASGRYYVKADEASTDVKYFADEWGYHPLVEYESSNTHSTSSARLAFGEKAVEALKDGTDLEYSVQLPARSQKRRPVQVIQPYILQKDPETQLDSVTRTPQPSANPESETGVPPDRNGAGTDQHGHHSNVPQESGSSNGISSEDAPAQTHFTEAQPVIYAVSTPAPPVDFVRPENEFKGFSSNSDAAIPDEQLFVQNSGSFGQRVHATPSGETSLNEIRYSTTTKSPPVSEAYSLTKQNGDVTYTVHSGQDSNSAYLTSAKKSKKLQRLDQYLYSQQLFASSDSGNLNRSVTSDGDLGGALYASTTIAPFDTSNQAERFSTVATDLQNAYSVKGDQASYEYSNAIGGDKQPYIGLEAYGGAIVAKTGYTKLGAANPAYINYALGAGQSSNGKERLQTAGLSAYSTGSGYAFSENEDSALTSGLQAVSVTSIPPAGTFSKPIVVAELADRGESKHGNALKCKDYDDVSSAPDPAYSTTVQPVLSSVTVLVTPKPPSHGRITTSSVILNPIQAGVALVNAGETHLITDGASRTPAPVEEKADLEDAQTHDNHQTVQLQGDSSEVKYEGVNPTFGEHQQQQEESNGVGESEDNDRNIEIQKSVEIFHNAPVQEIHYTSQPSASQVAQIDQLQGQQQYIELQNVENTQQAHRTNEQSTAEVSYEINHDSDIAYRTDEGVKLQANFQNQQDVRAQQAYALAQQAHEVGQEISQQALSVDHAQENAQQLNSIDEAQAQQLYSASHAQSNEHQLFLVNQIQTGAQHAYYTDQEQTEEQQFVHNNAEQLYSAQANSLQSATNEAETNAQLSSAQAQQQSSANQEQSSEQHSYAVKEDQTDDKQETAEKSYTAIQAETNAEQLYSHSEISSQDQAQAVGQQLFSAEQVQASAQQLPSSDEAQANAQPVESINYALTNGQALYSAEQAETNARQLELVNYALANAQKLYSTNQAQIEAQELYELDQFQNNAGHLYSASQGQANSQLQYSADREQKNARKLFSGSQHTNLGDAYSLTKQRVEDATAIYKGAYNAQQALIQEYNSKQNYQFNADSSAQQDYKSSFRNNVQQSYQTTQQAAAQREHLIDVGDINPQSHQLNHNGNSHSYEINHGQQQVAVGLPYTLEASKELIIPQVQTLESNIIGNSQQHFVHSHNNAHVTQSQAAVGDNNPNPRIESYRVDVSRLVEKPFDRFNEEKVEAKIPQPYSTHIRHPYPVEVEKIVQKTVHVPQPYPVHIHVPVDRIVEKTIRVPQPYQVDKIVEKKVPYPVEVQKVVETVVEKKVHVPQPYPVEKLIEKTVHVPQPYPVEKVVEKTVHVPQPYPVEKIVEKEVRAPQPYPVHIQVPVDRIVEKPVPVLQPFPVHIETIVEKKVPYAVEKLVPQPYPVHIRIPEPYPVEKIVERKVPYPVEKVVERPVRIEVPVEKIVERTVHVPQPYPVEVEKIVEKKVPYPVEVTRFIEKPVRINVPQPYPVEKIVEKKVPYPVEKIVEKHVHVPHPYPVEKIVEKPIHIPQPHPVEKIVEKIVEKPVHIKVPYPVGLFNGKLHPVIIPYGVQYGVSYQQIMKPQGHSLYASHQTTHPPLYGLPITSDQKNLHPQKNSNSDPKQQQQQFQGYSYRKPAIAFVEGGSSFAHKVTGNRVNDHNSVRHQQLQFKQSFHPGIPKEFGSHSNFPPQKQFAAFQSSFGYHPHWRYNLRTEAKEKADEYIGPVPPQHASNSQNHHKSQHVVQQRSPQHSTVTNRSPTTTSTSRRSRQQEARSQSKKGSFRQSRMEYGFKPPMIPSVQYDERTASKVER